MRQLALALLLLLACGDDDGDGDGGSDAGEHDAGGVPAMSPDAATSKPEPRDSGLDGSTADRCASNDPTGADGSTLIEGCPCTASEWICCPGAESSFSCDDGVWVSWIDGCNNFPPCDLDAASGGDSDGGEPSQACIPDTQPHAMSCLLR